MDDDRRSVVDRRSSAHSCVDGILVACRRIRRLLVEWLWDHGGTDVARIISTRNRILDAHWGMWNEVLGYDIRMLQENPSGFYIDHEERHDLIDEVEDVGAARRIVRLHRPTRGPLTMDIFMLQKDDRLFSFIKILTENPQK
ncbi:hypothetical protein [Desulfobotulus mexicanus]|uniref:Uncharacterized protein n=1 Tax=Desulfobotulus mexicanus TaxID=2586642 RepID=A0A5Q4VFB3_9BACT|nr:hypothetical protein [Desulfobotulus mexicanus]TYT75668.1 hypothetical protein FIM25_04315 [Desulfobotulus mexicanus]